MLASASVETTLLALKMNGQPLPDIYKALNRGILYEDGLDITDEILKALSSPSPTGGVQR